MGRIWIADQPFEVDFKVISWKDDPRFDAHAMRCVSSSRPCGGGGVFPFSEKVRNRAHRFAPRPLLRSFGKEPFGKEALRATQSVVRQFVVHHDGCPSAPVCFNVLHNERGLSCHFLIDNDGTIYQTLDLAFMGFHAAGANFASVGVEMCNRGDAKKFPTYYNTGGRRKRDVEPCKIHGHTYLAFQYHPEQMQALAALARTLRKALPSLPTDYPQASPGQQAWSVIDRYKSYTGYLGHYHITRQKWDPGPFDFKAFIESIGGVRCFPLAVRKEGPEIPDKPEELARDASKLYAANEERSKGGFFPVGPFGRSKLWHGGVHVMADGGTPIYAPFAGRIVAARVGSSSAVGSTNFVLIRHEMSLGPEQIRFFSLYYHLADEFGREAEKDVPGWIKSKAWVESGRRNQVILLDEPIEAMDIVGRVGEAGPPGERTNQVHLEVFSPNEITQKFGQRKWIIVDGTAGGRFADADDMIRMIDKDKTDGMLSRRELLEFFSKSPDRTLARYYGTLHVSEWTANPSWSDSLRLAADFRDVDRQTLDAMVADQITPGLWWDDRVAQHAKLPRDGVVFHYHPVTFIKSINDAILEAETLVDRADAKDAKVQPDDVKGDIDDVDGESFVNIAELEEEDLGQDLGLQDLANGFPQ